MFSTGDQGRWGDRKGDAMLRDVGRVRCPGSEAQTAPTGHITGLNPIPQFSPLSHGVGIMPPRFGRALWNSS